VHEVCTVGDLENAVQHDSGRTTLQLHSPLANVYDRLTATVCANVASATHGEAVGEVGGSGNAAVGNQQFVLKQAPLTYVSASTTSGRLSTLDMRVDGLLWHEVPSLFGRGPNEHVYSLRQDDEQRSIVQTGDGVEGARLPTGRDNVRFSYRRYLGAAGNVRADQLTTLLGRPLGVKAVTNPVDASGGQDGESRDDARRNAPVTVLTLGRAVSLQDYTDFSRGFGGIAKALSIWIGGGAARGIFVTVAGVDGAAIDNSSATYSNLIEALRRYGDPLLPLQVRSYAPVKFRIAARLKIAPGALAELVLPVVKSRLRQHFSFAARDFAQPVTLDEVMAVMQGVTGVEAVDVDALYRLGMQPDVHPRLFAHFPQVKDDGSLTPAELLTLHPGPLALSVMP
jgi:predicted phage baseplate assembly protein